MSAATSTTSKLGSFSGAIRAALVLSAKESAAAGKTVSAYIAGEGFDDKAYSVGIVNGKGAPGNALGVMIAQLNLVALMKAKLDKQAAAKAPKTPKASAKTNGGKQNGNPQKAAASVAKNGSKAATFTPAPKPSAAAKKASKSSKK
jgi:hypothetical protein